MLEIDFEAEIREKLTSARLGYYFGEVVIEPAGPGLLEFIKDEINHKTSRLSIDEVNQVPHIKASKEAYRKLGKDPSRYRPSAEALTRRILQGKGLFQINNFVDSLNIFSVRSGISIGGYDRDSIRGRIRFSTGQENEPYQAIGRGELNIAGLPVLRDYQGAFGSPTSDSARTMITQKTSRFLLVFFDFTREDRLEPLLTDAHAHFLKFCSIKNTGIGIQH
jgi:DNA/RNA-binding domain of Phe-tRNA-synthetase-like protein